MEQQIMKQQIMKQQIMKQQIMKQQIMMKNISLMGILAAGLALSTPVIADQEGDVATHSFSANVGLVSDFLVRGVSASDERPALQGGLDYAHKSGLYASVWASSMAEWDGAEMELDVWAGYANSLGAINYDLGVFQYMFPGNSEPKTTEVYAGVEYKGLGVKIYRSLTKYFNNLDSEGTTYYDINYFHPLPADVELEVHYGVVDGRGEQPDYSEWRIGLNKSLWGFDFGASYNNTNLDRDSASGEHWVLSVAREF
jgi:uncharacterized protein (TIGR02001 family)